MAVSLKVHGEDHNGAVEMVTVKFSVTMVTVMINPDNSKCNLRLIKSIDVTVPIDGVPQSNHFCFYL